MLKDARALQARKKVRKGDKYQGRESTARHSSKYVNLHLPAAREATLVTALDTAQTQALRNPSWSNIVFCTLMLMATVSISTASASQTPRRTVFEVEEGENTSVTTTSVCDVADADDFSLHLSQQTHSNIVRGEITLSWAELQSASPRAYFSPEDFLENSFIERLPSEESESLSQFHSGHIQSNAEISEDYLALAQALNISKPPALLIKRDPRAQVKTVAKLNDLYKALPAVEIIQEMNSETLEKQLQIYLCASVHESSDFSEAPLQLAMKRLAKSFNLKTLRWPLIDLLDENDITLSNYALLDPNTADLIKLHDMQTIIVLGKTLEKAGEMFNALACYKFVNHYGYSQAKFEIARMAYVNNWDDDFRQATQSIIEYRDVIAAGELAYLIYNIGDDFQRFQTAMALLENTFSATDFDLSRISPDKLLELGLLQLVIEEDINRSKDMARKLRSMDAQDELGRLNSYIGAKEMGGQQWRAFIYDEFIAALRGEAQVVFPDLSLFQITRTQALGVYQLADEPIANWFDDEGSFIYKEPALIKAAKDSSESLGAYTMEKLAGRFPLDVQEYLHLADARISHSYLQKRRLERNFRTHFPEGIEAIDISAMQEYLLDARTSVSDKNYFISYVAGKYSEKAFSMAAMFENIRDREQAETLYKNILLSGRNTIRAINGLVNLLGPDSITSLNLRRLQRTIEKAKAGDQDAVNQGQNLYGDIFSEMVQNLVPNTYGFSHNLAVGSGVAGALVLAGTFCCRRKPSARKLKHARAETQLDLSFVISEFKEQLDHCFSNIFGDGYVRNLDVSKRTLQIELSFPFDVNGVTLKLSSSKKVLKNFFQERLNKISIVIKGNNKDSKIRITLCPKGSGASYEELNHEDLISLFEMEQKRLYLTIDSVAPELSLFSPSRPSKRRRRKPTKAKPVEVFEVESESSSHSSYLSGDPSSIGNLSSSG